MLPTPRTAAQLRLTLRVGSSNLQFNLPRLAFPSTSAPTWPHTPALATELSAPEASNSSSAAASEGWLSGLWDGLLRAVPKKKVSHSRKSMRAANKGLKDRVDLVHCSGCGKPKAQHHICGFCYAELNRARKVALNSKSPATQPSSDA